MNKEVKIINTQKNIATHISFLILIFMLGIFVYIPKLSADVMAQDEGILLVYPDLILRGLEPYKDFSAIYTPGSFYVIALAFKAFGSTILVERLVGFLYWLMMAGSVYLIGARYSRSLGLVATLPIFFVMKIYPVGAYSMIGALGLSFIVLMLSFRTFSEPNSNLTQKYLPFLSGVFAGFALWFRQDVGVITIAVLFIIYFSKKLDRMLYSLLGVGIPLLLFIIFLFHVGIDRSFDNLVIDVLRNAPGRKLPIHFGPVLITLLLMIAGNIAIAIIAFRKKFQLDQTKLVLGIAILTVGLLPSALQRTDRWHVYYVGAPIISLSLISIFFLVHNLEKKEIFENIVKFTGIPIFLLVFFGINHHFFGSRINPIKIHSGERWIFYSHSHSAGDLQNLITETNKIGKNGNKLFVGPDDLRFTNENDSYLYFLFPKLQPSTKFIEMNPGVANRSDSGLSEQIGKADLVILTSRHDHWDEPNDSMIPGSDLPNKIIKNNFCLYKKFIYWNIFKRCFNKKGKGISFAHINGHINPDKN